MPLIAGVKRSGTWAHCSCRFVVSFEGKELLSMYIDLLRSDKSAGAVLAF